MEKLFIVEQPPHSEKFRLLVDECIETGQYGLTTDRDKVLYNLELMSLREQVQWQAAASAQGMSFVFEAGRYIGIAAVKKDFSRMSMEFFDFQAYGDFREWNATTLNHEFSEKVVTEFELLRSQLMNSFREPEDDRVELAIV